ncbi:hypothetical protein [Kibdelosporangium philippinense]|uniref:hypothetical protein n=1 Tax=Kibdelosporangium philippinense TaxID=211113 RepID=UPI0036219590
MPDLGVITVSWILRGGVDGDGSALWFSTVGVVRFNAAKWEEHFLMAASTHS